MATTELHKVPDTILSRVQEFEFRTIPLQKILKRLKTIAQAEHIRISDEGLKQIARSGEGSMRDAQSNFDQVISFSGNEIGTEDVITALGIASAENLTNTIQAIADKDPQVILIATGSELELAMDAAEQLAQESIAARVVSMPCVELFEAQSPEYQASVLPASVTARVAVEAAQADYWYKFVGLNGAIVGMTSFGESAPAGELFKHFNITVDAVVEAAKQVI